MLKSNVNYSVYLIAIVIILISAAITGCGMTYNELTKSEPIIRVTHLSGGDGDVVTMLEIYDPDLITFQVTSVGKKRVKRISSEEYEQIQSILSRPELIEEIQDQPSADGYFDWEKAIIYLNDSVYGIVIEKQPPETHKWFGKIDTIFKKHFGRHYRISLSEGYLGNSGDNAN